MSDEQKNSKKKQMKEDWERWVKGKPRKVATGDKERPKKAKSDKPFYQWRLPKAGPIVSGKAKPRKKFQWRTFSKAKVETKEPVAKNHVQLPPPPSKKKTEVITCPRTGCTKACIERAKEYKGDLRKICVRRFLKWWDGPPDENETEEEYSEPDLDSSTASYDTLCPDSPDELIDETNEFA